jgi:hypothetical protein
MMARDILAIQAAGVGIERGFSIAGSFNLDDRTYSPQVLSALMVCNHYQSEENRDSKKRYYLELRVEQISAEDIVIEEEDDTEAIALTAALTESYISDDNEDVIEGDNESDEEQRPPPAKNKSKMARHSRKLVR